MPSIFSDGLVAVRDVAASVATSVSSDITVESTTEQPVPTLGGTDIIMLLLTISVVLRVLNFHYVRIPSSVAMAFGAILITLILLVLSLIPMLGITKAISGFRVFLKDFPDILLNNMLSFLLFAASIEVDLRNLGRILSTVLALSFVSTLISTFMVATGTYFLMQLIAPMDYMWCLLFGAIVSPTDPVTIVSILNEKPDLLPSSTRYFVICESLLNDAVGVVLYLTMFGIVQKPDIDGYEIVSIAFETIIVECIYGAAIGIFLAWLAYSAIVSVKEPLLEVVITFVLVGNINVICRIFHASIPLASVCAGLFIGNYAVTFAMHDETTETFHEIWKLTDETLNSILFLMIGAADVFWDPQKLGLGRVLLLVVGIISISMITRLVAVALPLLAIILIEWITGKRLRHKSVRYRGGTIAVLTWAGMRGGISIALALGVPDSFVPHAIPGHVTYGQLIFFMTFILVVYSILVQGLFFEPVVRMINRVSYQVMPSGGLGTYVSTMSLGNGGHGDDEDEDEEEGGDVAILSGEDNVWEGEEAVYGTTPLYKDYDENVPSAPLLARVDSNPKYLRGNLPRTASDVGYQNVQSMSVEAFRPSGLPSHLTADAPHERQGSLTFQNLPNLSEMPSIPVFFGNLRRSGTFSIQRWFEANNRIPVGRHDTSAPLRRSRTEPDNARLAREGASIVRPKNQAGRKEQES